MNATQSSLQLPTSLHTSLNLPAGFHLCRSCGHASDSPTSNVREAPGLAWSRQLVWSCQCLHLQTRCACSSSFQPFHTTTPPLYELSLSLSPSPSLTFCLALRASLLPHTTRYAGCYHTPRRTAPHRTHYYHSTPHYHPHSTLTTHHRRNTFCHRLGLSHSYTPAIHPSIHCCTTPTLDPLPRNRVVFVEASLQHTSGSTACIGTRHTRTKARQTR